MYSLSNRSRGIGHAVALSQPALGTKSVVNVEVSPLQACFGVACLYHHRCARYAAVADSQADPRTMGTCLTGDAYPMFMEVSVSQSTIPR